MADGIMQMIFIDGNIRQQYLPFVLKPKSNINLKPDDAQNISDGPQFFSFKKPSDKEDQYKAGFARLNICPSVLRDPNFGIYFNKDISNKVLYSYLKADDSGKYDSITIDSFLDQLPSMQIREFQVDSRLDQFINLFFELFQSAKGLFKEFKITDLTGIGDSDSAIGTWFKMFKDVLATCWDYCTNQGDYADGPNIMLKAKNGDSRWANGGTKADYVLQGLQEASPPNLDTYLIDFPFMMYYRLQSCTTLNVYELPYIGDQMYSSDGSGGWKDASMALKDMTGGGDGGGMLGKVINMVTGFGDLINRAKINYMPKWDPTGDGTLESLTVTFDLFNDTAEAAMKNFIFVNTIIPNNLWMQYGMLKHSPCLYDVKIDGLKRMFLCAADFKVKASGLLRTPPVAWISELCLNHANSSDKKNAGRWNKYGFMHDIMDNNLIKIPDVYTVEMTFKSLIPANFNNWLFSYSKNSKMEHYGNSNAYQSSVFGDVLKSIQTDLGKEIEKVIAEGNKKVAAARAAEEEKSKQNKK